MIQTSGIYTFLIVAPMVAATIYERMYGGGNHWFLFGTRLDQLLQHLGFLSIAILPMPLAVAACVAVFRRNVWEYAIVGVFFALCIAASFFFIIMVLD